MDETGKKMAYLVWACIMYDVLETVPNQKRNTMKNIEKGLLITDVWSL